MSPICIALVLILSQLCSIVNNILTIVLLMEIKKNFIVTEYYSVIIRERMLNKMHLRPALTSVSQRCSWEMHFARLLHSASILLLVSSQCTLHMPQKNFTKNGKDTTDIEYFKVSALRQHVISRLIIVNVLKIPIQIQFGLEKSMTTANAKIQYNNDTTIFNVFSSSQSLIRSKHGLAIRSDSEHKNMYS